MLHAGHPPALCYRFEQGVVPLDLAEPLLITRLELPHAEVVQHNLGHGWQVQPLQFLVLIAPANGVQGAVEQVEPELSGTAGNEDVDPIVVPDEIARRIDRVGRRVAVA